MNEIENLLKAIREEKAFYGFDDAKEKITLGSAESVIVSETFLKEMKQKNKYQEIDSLLRIAEDMNAKIIILTDKEMMKKIDSLGGIAGVTRWKTN
jgi:stalled ribosome rescue protein Dom34